MRLLEPEYLIGRAAGCALSIKEAYVSAQHAMLRWADGHWEVRDLGSRNGTFLDGARLNAGENYALRQGAKLDLGGHDQVWELVDDAPPAVMAVPVAGGEPVLLEGEFLSLPSADDPRVTIYRGPDGWVLEEPDTISTIGNSQTFEVDHAVWRFCCPDNVLRTALAPGSGSESVLQLQDLKLVFSVSSDEEHVHLQVDCKDRRFDLGARNHNYLLLTLARQRLRDESAGEAESRRGWIYQDDFMREPGASTQQLNVDVFRIRKQFAALGVAEPAAIVERRPRTQQMRIGGCALAIVPL